MGFNFVLMMSVGMLRLREFLENFKMGGFVCVLMFMLFIGFSFIMVVY